MRVLILGVSTLALGACSMGGVGWGHGHNAHHQAHNGYYGQKCGVTANPCATKPVSYQHAPVYHAPAKVAPRTVSCKGGPCSAGSYAVSPYAPVALHAQTPDAHAYGAYHGHHPKLRGAHSVGPKGQFYGTLGAALVDVDEEAVALQARLGYQATEFFGAELEGSVGVLSDKEDLGGGDEIRTNIEYGGALFATARLPLGDRLNVLARGGYHVTEVEQTAVTGGVEVRASETIDDFAYGVGVELAVSPFDSIRADYTRYEGGTSFGTQDTVSLSWLRRF